MRIVQLANLVTPTSGGIRTVLDEVGRGYATAGHERHLVVPSRERAERSIAGGTAWLLPATRLPGSGGYRVLIRRREVERRLDRLAPDRIEVSDRYTLTWAAAWARDRGVRSLALVHEHLGDTLAAWIGPRGLTDRAAAVADRRLVAAFDRVVCASRHSAEPFAGAAAVVPLGVDLDTFRPRAGVDHRGLVRLVVTGRLSREKRPDLAVAAVRELERRGVPVLLDVVGGGPLRDRVAAAARGLPVHLRGHVADRDELAATVAAADVALCPCPTEAFGLAALEALACGTPIVTTGGGPLDLLADAPAAAGMVASPTAAAIADAVERLLGAPRTTRREAARGVAERYPWTRTTASLLALHAGPATAGVAA